MTIFNMASSKPSEGGSRFDCEFVKKPPEVVQSECPVCLQILCEPYQVSCCGYSYCEVCIERLKSNNKPCPTCKEENFKTFHNKGLKRSLYGLQVYCSHKQEGCEWKGELGQLDNHLNLSPQPDKQLEGCKYSEIECIYCSELIKRRHIADHQTEHCPKRPFSCEHCHSYESHYEDVINNHWPVCGYHPVQCRNECGTFPQRQALENHIVRDCPKTVIDCDFHHVGCDVKLPRKDMPAHLNENLVTHMSLQATCYSKLLASHNKLLDTNNALLRALQEKVNKLETENGTLKQHQVSIMATQTNLQGNVRKLESENEKLRHQQVSTMASQTSLKEKVNKLERENETLKASHATLETRHNKLQSDYSKLLVEVKKRKLETAATSFKHHNTNKQTQSSDQYGQSAKFATQQHKASNEDLGAYIDSGVSDGQAESIKKKHTRECEMRITQHCSTMNDSQSVLHTQAHVNQLPQCKADDCNNPVHCEMGIPPDIGVFEYCSPQCRDRHMLPLLQVQLQRDIEALLEIASTVSSVSRVHNQRPHRPTKDVGSVKTTDIANNNAKQLEGFRSLDKSHDNHKPVIEIAAKSEMSSVRKAAANKLNTHLVIFIKDKGEDCGIIVSQELMTDTVGFLITGVVVDSKAYKCFQDDQLRLYDIIRTVNSKTHVPGSEISTQKLFDDMVHLAGSVSLAIDRSTALPPVSKHLKETRRRASARITHVIAMRPSKKCESDDFGLLLQDRVIEVQVVGCVKGSPAYLAGLKYGDMIQVCAVASQKEFEKQYITAATKHSQSLNFKEIITKTLKRATKEKKAVVLFVFRETIKMLY